MYLILYSENNLYNEMKKEGCQDWKPHRTRVKPYASFPIKIAPHCDGCSFFRILSCLLCLFNTLTKAHTLAYCYLIPYYFAYSQSSNSLILIYQASTPIYLGLSATSLK